MRLDLAQGLNSAGVGSSLNVMANYEQATKQAQLVRAVNH
jgi:hypothetical protein